MKRTLFLLLCALLVFGSMACSGGGNANVLRDYLNEYGDELNEMVAPLGAVLGEGGRVEISSNLDDELVFLFVYDHNLPSEIMVSIIESMEVFFAAFAESLREELEFPELRVVARYMDTNDNVLEEQNF